MPKAGTNILMVCYYYPPLADVATKRSIAFSRYFKKYGWEPIVLSVKNPDKAYCSIGTDKPPHEVHTEYSYSVLNVYKVLGKLNGLTSKILRFIGCNLSRNYFLDILCIPDIFWGWIPLATMKGLKLIRRFNIDVIYVSCSPFSAAFIGIWLKAISGKPLIIDFRDIYALEVESIKYLPNKSYFRTKIDKWFEKMILSRADLLIVTTREMESMYTQAYPQIGGRIFTIHNGFDPEALPKNSHNLKYSKFTICYAGNFYFEAVGREVFFEALSLLHRRGVIYEGNFQFLYYGDWSQAIKRMSIDFQIEDLVQVTPRIPHEMVLPIIKKSHLQLLRIIKPMISTKLYEGIALNIPLLAIIPPGEVADIIHRFSPISYVITENSSKKVADAIFDAMCRYQENEIQANNIDDFLEHFSREKLAIKLIKLLDDNLN